MMARQPISRRRNREIKLIENKPRRNATFSKRRHTLFKHTEKLCKSAGARGAAIVFSGAGNAFEFGHPSVDDVIAGRYASGSGEVEADSGDPPMTEMERRLNEALATGRLEWGELTKDLGVKEVGELEEAVAKIQWRLKKWTEQ